MSSKAVYIALAVFFAVSIILWLLSYTLTPA